MENQLYPPASGRKRALKCRKNRGSETIAIVGIRTRGEFLGRRLAAKLAGSLVRDITHLVSYLDHALARFFSHIVVSIQGT